jgi:hypothetical protein
MVMVSGEVVAGVKFEAVAIGIADERAGNAMPPGATLDIF